MLALGEGQLPLADVGDDVLTQFMHKDLIEVPTQYTMGSQNGADLIHYVYGDLQTQHRNGDCADYRFLADRAILTPLNRDVATLNHEMLNAWDGEELSLLSADTVGEDDSNALYPLEFLHNIEAASIPPHHLRLKKGVILMLLTNLNRSAGLCNGTRLIFQQYHNNVLEVIIATGSRRGQSAFIPRVSLTPNDVSLGFELKRRQYPVKLAFAMTIHKSQGQSLRRVGVFLPQPVFSHGLLYVALSRVGNAEDVRVMVLDFDRKHGHVKCQNRALEPTIVLTRNVVYPEIFEAMQIRATTTNTTNAHDFQCSLRARELALGLSQRFAVLHEQRQAILSGRNQAEETAARARREQQRRSVNVSQSQQVCHDEYMYMIMI